MMVSLNGVIQAPNTSYSVSGSTITFLPSSGTLSSSDSIDFIMVYGNILDLGVASSVTDSSITKGKLNLISDSSSAGLTVKGDGSSENGTIQLNCSQNTHGVKISSPAHSSGQSYELILPTGNVTADKVLKVASVSGSGATGIGQLSFGDAGGTNTPSFFAFANTNFTVSNTSFTKIPFNDEKFDTANAFNTSTNAFTVPSGQAGKYFFAVACRKNNSRTDRNLLDFRVNDTGVMDTETGSYSNYGASVGTTVISLSVGDVVNAYIYHDRGSDQTFRGSSTAKDTFLCGFKIIE
jgi:hypothetical protein